ncbi:MAG: hypothetical protein JXQ30_10555 [Spirochaetes bacterium]|nr:hypothetical protein [Spirochaetota bacterium]
MKTGKDLLAIVEGGDRPHIGSVAVAVPHESIRKDKTVSSTVSVHNLPRHRDGEIAAPLAKLLAETANRVTVVSAGFHIDNAAPADIEAVLEQMSRINDIVAGKVASEYGTGGGVKE